MNDFWYRVSDTLPDEGERVRVISHGGIECTLIRQGNLWFDGDIYMYWTPMFWRYL